MKKEIEIAIEIYGSGTKKEIAKELRELAGHIEALTDEEATDWESEGTFLCVETSEYEGD